jgi:SCO1/SenC
MKTSSHSSEPLSLTVHSLPDPLEVQAPASGRGKLLAIFLACSLPLLVAYLIFFIVKPTGKASFGELIHPAREMPAVNVQLVEFDSNAASHESVIPLSQLKGQWLLVNVTNTNCDDICAQRLFVMRQLREMVGKEKDRIDRVLLITSEAPLAENIKPLLEGLTIIRVKPELIEKWFGITELQDVQAQVVIVDPMGNAMLRMPADLTEQQPHEALRVLNKLLTASAVWDMPGR